MHVHAMIQTKNTTCAPSCGGLFIGRSHLAERSRKSWQCLVHRCQKSKMKWIELSYWVALCWISKSVLPRLFTMMIKWSLRGEPAGGGGGGSDQHPASTCSLGVNSDLGEWFLSSSVQVGINSACTSMCTLDGGSSFDRIIWPLISRDVHFFLKCMKTVGASAQRECGLVWKQFQCHPKARRASAFVTAGLRGVTHTPFVLLHTHTHTAAAVYTLFLSDAVELACRSRYTSARLVHDCMYSGAWVHLSAIARWYQQNFW